MRLFIDAHERPEPSETSSQQGGHRPVARIAAAALLLTVAALGACGQREEPKQAPPPKAPEVAPQPAAKPDLPPPPPTVFEAALAKGTAVLDSPQSITDTLGAAAALETWATENAAHEQAASARFLAARERFLAYAAAVGLDTEPALKALGDDAAREKLVTDALAAAQAAKQAGVTAEGLDPARLEATILAIQASDPAAKEVTLDYEGARALALGDTPEGEALRIVWMGRVEKALQALRTDAPELRPAEFEQDAGRLLCPACADAHHATPDMVTHFLLNSRQVGGLLCEEAHAAAKTAKTPSEQIAAIRKCTGKLGLKDPYEDTLLWGSNLLALGVVENARDLAAAPAGEGALAPALKKRAEALSKALDGGVLLPVPAIVAALPAEGERPEPKLPAVITELGFGGLTADREIIDLFVVGPEGVSTGLRPVVAAEGNQLASLSAAAGYPANGKLAMTREALAEAKPDPKTGAVEELVTAATATRTAAEALAPKVEPPTFEPTPAGRGASLVVDAEAPAHEVELTLDSLLASGYAHFRFLKTGTRGMTLPLLVRAEPEGLRERLKLGWTRPIIVGVTGTAVDVWQPAGPLAERGEGDAHAKVPEGVTTGYRGAVLARLRVPIPEDAKNGLDKDALAKVGEAIDYFVARSGSGPLVHVSAGEGARAADVLRVARLYQEKKGKALDKPEELWPGTRCGGEDYRQARREPDGCPTGVAVAFSREAIPSGAGLTLTPKTGAPPPPPPEAGFCDKRDIQVPMNKLKASFRFCYERELQLKKDLAGRVVVKFTVPLGGGSPTGLRIMKTTLKNPNVERCVIDAIKKRAKFPKPDGGTCQVRWPMAFSPQ